MKNVSYARSKFSAMAGLLLALALAPTSGGTNNRSRSAAASEAQPQEKLVYVCGCLKNK